MRAVGLIVFSSAFLVPILSALNPVAAQTAVSDGSVEPVGQPGENPSSQGVIRITVDLVQVDVVVTDSKGHQVTNLGPEDFEILEDGRPQTITNFSYIVTGQPAGIAAQSTTPPAADGIPAVPPVRLQPEQVRRTIVILVDDLHIAFQNMVYVRKAIRKFIDNDVQPGDLVAVLHTSGGLGVQQQFTNDKRVLHAAVNRLRYHLFGGWGLEVDSVPWALRANGRGEKNELKGVRKDLEAAERSESDFRRKAMIGGTLGALEYVLGGLRDLPGRKAVFLVSDGFSFCSIRDRTPETDLQRLRKVADLANRSAAVVYTVSAQGLPTLSLDASVGSPGLNSQWYAGTPPRLKPWWYADSLSRMRTAYFFSQGPMAYLAQYTGGLFVHDDNDIAAGMHELMEDLSGYYLIGYKPSADTFKADKAGPGFHRIQVRVKVRGLHARTRPGFFGIPDSNTRPVYSTREDQLRAAIVSPFSTSGVRVQLAPQFLNHRSTESVARLRLHIDARDLTFQDAPDGSKKATADLVALAYGDNGAVASGVGGTLRGSFQPSELEALREHGAKYRLDLPIKEPGGYQVRVAVRDAASHKVGSAREFIEIPKQRPDRLALSGIVLNVEALGERGPVVRKLKAGDRVSYQLEIYNARRDGAAQAPNLESSIQIFHDGRRVSAPKPGAIRQVPSDANGLVMSGEFELAPDMLPGDYALLVTVIDKLAPPRHSSARQWIDFEVAP